MTTAGSVLAARVATALADDSVATQAGVAALTWASADAPRVFHGLGGYLQGRNRGRLPFVEYAITGQTFDSNASGGGTMTQTVTVRAHCGGRDLGTASDLTAAILAAGMAAIRDNTSDVYTDMGDDAVGELQPGAWGHQRDASMTFIQSFDRDTYEVT